jgi:hypothetical protein
MYSSFGDNKRFSTLSYLTTQVRTSTAKHKDSRPLYISMNLISIWRGHDQSNLANVFQFSVDCYSQERGRENILTKVVGLHIGMGTLFYNYFFLGIYYYTFSLMQS